MIDLNDLDPHDDRDPYLAAALRRTYLTKVDDKTVARHLASIEREALRLRVTRLQEVRDARRPRRLMIAGLAALLILAMSTAAVAASTRAGYGDPLYSIKTDVADRARLLVGLVTGNEEQVEFEIARERYQEFQEALRTSTLSPEALEELQAEVERSLDAVQDPALAQEASELREQASEVVAQATASESQVGAVTGEPTTGPPATSGPADSGGSARVLSGTAPAIGGAVAGGVAAPTDPRQVTPGAEAPAPAPTTTPPPTATTTPETSTAGTPSTGTTSPTGPSANVSPTPGG